MFIDQYVSVREQPKITDLLHILFTFKSFPKFLEELSILEI